MRRDEALKFVDRFVPEMFPGADTVLVCGSTARDEAKATSDIDLVVIYEKLPRGAWRLTESHDGTLVEAFVHDLETLLFFLERARPSALPILARMVAEGIPLAGLPSRCLASAKALATGIISAGPPAKDSVAFAHARYTISSLADDLTDARSRHHRLAIAASLYSALSDFVLRAGGDFSGAGKGLAVALETHEPALAARFDTAFASLFADGDAGPIQHLVDDALAPHGGRLVDGYRAEAPADWRRKE